MTHRNRDGLGGSPFEADVSGDHLLLSARSHLPAASEPCVCGLDPRCVDPSTPVENRSTRSAMACCSSADSLRCSASCCRSACSWTWPVRASGRSSRLPAHRRPADSQDQPVKSGAAPVRLRSEHVPPVGHADAAAS